MKKPVNRHFFKGTFLILALALVFLTAPTKPAAAAAADTLGGPIQIVKNATEPTIKKLEKAWKKVGSNIFQTVITNALKRAAYDAATWVGSGGEGQKPLFITKNAGAYVVDLADSAAGDFIDDFAKNSGINYCNPNLDVKLKIGLGLVDKQTGTKVKDSKCKASTMIKAWKTDITAKYEAMKDPAYLKNLSSMFSVGGNDLSMALDVMDGMDAKVSTTTKKNKLDLAINEGFLPKENIGGKKETPPGTEKNTVQSAQNELSAAKKVSPTESVITDASKVFLNTLASTAFNTAIKKLASVDVNKLWNKYFDNTKEENSAALKAGGYRNSCLGDPNCDPTSVSGVESVRSNLAEMIKPSFDSRGDYDILGELSVCPDPNKPGPTNCILDSQFSTAISDQKTVIEAIKDGSLNKTWRLMRDIDFNQGYSLRSLLVLRKFRVIPVGWETALLKAEANGANATLMDMVSCFDPNDNYNEFSQGFTPAAWCQGLVDPNWVLKAPLNYCKRQGYGNQILDKTITPSQTVGEEVIPGDIIMTRADEYCADEQSCIKEKADGTCSAYGYCTEEKRTWDFTSDSCDAIYNTCQTFTKSSGASVSYLENTIDYSTCSADSVGCRPYSTFGTYNVSSDQIGWNPLKQIYFSKKVEACDNSQEGCTELIRTVPEAGHNFLINSDFEEDLSVGSWNTNADGNNNGATTTPDGYFSSTSIIPSALFNKNVAVGPNGYDISGRVYTFSFYAKNCIGTSNQASFGSSNVDNKVINLSASADWGYYSITYSFPLGSSNNQVYFAIQNLNNSCQIDRLKLELSGVGTSYSPYYSNNLIYQKLIPDYLANACYANPSSATPDYSLKADAPAKCSNYTRRCNASEVDCNLYKSVRDGFSLPAKVTPFDSCLAECDGYDSYIQKDSVFHNSVASNFIPSTAASCNANAVGCSEFTNIDAVSQGGESKEYYSFLRQCIKPDENACGVFYSWGNAGSGYSLQPYSLKASDSAPVLTSGSFVGNSQVDENNNVVCSEAIYNARPSDANYNSDCRQLYNKAGAIYYALNSKTITCSSNCHAYRLSEAPIDESLTDTASCNGAGGHWNASTTACQVCKNGGVWNNDQNGCIYQAIPGEGQTCSASENGCREYNGNYGNNLQIINSYDFENNTAWNSFHTDSSSLSSDSINKDGHSLQYITSGGTGSNNFLLPETSVSSIPSENNIFASIRNFFNSFVRQAAAQSNNALPGRGIGVTIGNAVSQNSAYVVRFLAKATSNVSVNVYLGNNTGVASHFVASPESGAVNISGNNEWKMYSLNLAALDHQVTDQEALIFSASGSLLLDNITLTEVTDRYYLIENSWNTPNACYYDTLNEYQGANYNLGCSAYTTKSNETVYLRNFDRLCQDSSVGCELMTLTNNSANPGAEAFQETEPANNHCDASDGASCVEVPADKMIYAVYDESKQCGSENKGCSRLGGQLVTNQDVTVQSLYSDVYIKNNPDKYSSALCGAAEVGCDEWTYSDGQASYFKDPGNNVCEWRQPLNATGLNLQKKWYKKPVKRCDFNNNQKIDISGNLITESPNRLCSTDADCGTGKCITDQNNYLCTVDSLKTIGLGGGNLVYQPQTMVGTCEAKAASCTEYIDPVSEFSPNIVVNPNWGDINKDTIKGDGWANSNTALGQKQTVYLLKNKLYSFSVKASSAATKDTVLTCPAAVRILMADNSFSAATTSITIARSETSRNILFNSLNNVSCTLYGGEEPKTINIRGTVVDYKLLAGVDKTGCNGAANFDAGCIMFNERKQSGSSGLNKSTWTAYGGSYNVGSPIATTSEIADSNVLIKVKPNRECSKWLSCLSMGIDPTSGEESCYALGECDKLGDSGRCENFVAKNEVQHTFNSGSDRNIAGYSKMDNYYLANMKEVGVDAGANWNFEEAASLNGNANFSTTVSNGIKVSYPAVGKGLASIGTSANLSSFSVVKGSEYFVNYLINIDASGGNGGTLRVLGSGVNEFASTTSGTGWQRKVLRFVPTASGNAYIQLATNSTLPSQPVYFDDINIEPVLKTNTNSYIPKECRLYPKQDSLSCKSDNPTVTANGIYGYCLEHDPKNPDVCIMWYPIDNVKSSLAATGASTGWVGYNGITNPYYCAEVKPNFLFAERRSAFYVGSFNVNSDNNCGSGLTPTGYLGLQYGFTSVAPQGLYIDSSTQFSASVTAPSGYKFFVMSYKNGNNCTYDYYGIPNGSNTVVSRIFDPTPNGGDWHVINARDLSFTSSSWDNSQFIFSHSNTFGNGDYSPKIEVSNGIGWYAYDGAHTLATLSKGDDEIGTHLIDFDENPSGMVKAVSGYSVKCNQFVKAEKPWVGRMSQAPSTSYFTGTPYSSYKFTYPTQPFGGVDDNINFTTSTPYSCVPGRSGSFVNLCNSVHLNPDNGNIYVYFGNSSNPKYSNAADYYKDNLKQIFLKATGVNGYGYNYSFGTSEEIPKCDGTLGRTRPLGWCSVYPTINSGITLKDIEGRSAPFVNGAYSVASAGYYTLNFGVVIDKEQLPVGRLVIDFGDGTEKLTVTQIDPSSNYRFTHYYNPQSGTAQSYKIRIKVEDNWGFYKCSGLPNSNNFCNNCCYRDFDQNECSGCN